MIHISEAVDEMLAELVERCDRQRSGPGAVGAAAEAEDQIYQRNQS